MITGDQALTACHVAQQVHIISKPALILGRAKNKEVYAWVSPDETEIVSYRYEMIVLCSIELSFYTACLFLLKILLVNSCPQLLYILYCHTNKIGKSASLILNILFLLFLLLKN